MVIPRIDHVSNFEKFIFYFLLPENLVRRFERVVDVQMQNGAVESTQEILFYLGFWRIRPPIYPYSTLKGLEECRQWLIPVISHMN